MRIHRAHVPFVVLVLLLGCSRATTPPVEISQDPTLGTLPLGVVAIVPAIANGSDVSEGAAGAVTELMAIAAAKAAVWRIVEPTTFRGAASQKDETAAARAGRLATAAKADAGLTAEISRFHERVGGDFGVAEPASVAIRLLLVPAGKETPVWRADYVFTQLPLAYNLWNFWQVQRGGVKWLTAGEVARIGIDEAIGRLTGQPVPDR
jgi:hypothetical protein